MPFTRSVGLRGITSSSAAMSRLAWSTSKACLILAELRSSTISETHSRTAGVEIWRISMLPNVGSIRERNSDS